MTPIEDLAMSLFTLYSLVGMINADCYVDHCDLNYCSGDGCIKCKDGYYIQDTACYPCQPSCLTCSSSSTCTECKRGWHGPTCSSECKAECIHCSSFSQCLQCVPGRYGSYCQHYCPLSCINILCDIESGKCTEGCRHGYYLEGGDCETCPENCARCSNYSHCTDCIVGYYGDLCQTGCPTGCKHHVCEKEAGLCTEGCAPGYYNEEGICTECPYRCAFCTGEYACEECQTGYWGQQCEHDCPLNCLDCDMEGNCVEGPVCSVDYCDRAYCWNSSCIQCEDGYHIEDMSCFECPEYCTKCSGPTTCTECVLGRFGSTCTGICRNSCVGCTESSECTSCIPGRYGLYCQLYCPLGCLDILCDKESGICLRGCRHGFYRDGEECEQCPGHCVRCTDSGDCTSCIPGFYGDYCQLDCSKSCRNQICDKDLGYCTEDCATGYFFEENSCLPCPERCSTCSDMDSCTECKSDYWGTRCQHDCPLTCYRCTKDGTCLYDSDCQVDNCKEEYCSENSCIQCEDGFYLSGTLCYRCPENCTSCDGLSSCNDCVGGRYGTVCENICASTCVNCVSESQCTDCLTGYYGVSCELTCQLGCIDINCDKDSGRCLEGCRHGYYIGDSGCTECPEHCTRCTGENYCTHCTVGYYGPRCQHTCPVSCENDICNKDSGHCIDGCKQGFYSDHVDSCAICPQKCSRCKDVHTCSECKTGYWGNQCMNACPLDCFACTIDGICLSYPICDISNCDRNYCVGSSCIKCSTGFYLSGTHCYECPPYCTDCSDSITCTECVQGRYGSECQYTCSSVCTDCISASQCTECVAGRHGSFCQFYCPLGCIDILCEKESGRCSQGCRHGYFISDGDCVRCPEQCAKCQGRNQCTECVNGFYGSVCQYECHQSCKNRSCDKLSGTCVNGCIKGYYEGNNVCIKCPTWCASCTDEETCDACRDGRWGSHCQNDCPAECNRCSRQGECLSGGGEVCNIDHCEKAFCSKTSCIKCEDGYFLSGTHCYQCNEFCTRCTGSSSCSECVKGRYGLQCEYTCSSLCTGCLSSSVCTECIAGRYGPTCQSYCPLGCKNILCNKESGSCVDGCRRGFYQVGDNCNSCPEACSSCSDSSHCTICSRGYYGSSCQWTCPRGCKNHNCQKDTGYCIDGCVEGYYEDGFCLPCPIRCESCSGQNSCSKCKTGYFGSKCQHHCPNDCYSCTSDGSCIDFEGPECFVHRCDRAYCFNSGCTKCESGYYLYETDCHECPSECKECTTPYQCTKCQPGKYGTMCEYSCGRTCTDCINSEECLACIPGRYGSVCQQYCPLGCKNILCDKNSGKCTAGCRNGYYLEEEECIQCPETCTKCWNETYCTGCEDGLYGDLCQRTCHVGCEEQICNVRTGNCTYGCADGYHYHLGYCVEDMVNGECQVPHCDVANCFGGACTLCNVGYYLEEFKCYQCPDHCITCSSAVKCDQCTAGRYGTVCQHSCDDGCKGSVCSKDAGFCVEGCKEAYIMSKGVCKHCPNNCVSCTSQNLCSTCEMGFWGDTCTYECAGCTTEGCGTVRNCTNGCRSGYFAQPVELVRGAFECLKCPEDCDTCTSTDTCITCKSGYWGDVCSNTCSGSCKEGKCHRLNGFCNDGCENGFYGDTCSQTCLSRCDTCFDGSSCTTCAAGRHGVMCEQRCSPHCFRYVCDRDNGTCPFGCSVGFSGEKCDKATDTITSTRSDAVDSSKGVAIGLGVSLAIAAVTITILTIFLLRKRRPSKEDDTMRVPPMMNQTYDTRIGTADFFVGTKGHNRPYENTHTTITDDQSIFDVSRRISNYPTPSYNGSDKDYYEEAEYSSIKSSADIASF